MPRTDFQMVLLPDGNVLAAGGIDDNVTLASADLYNPAAGTWTATGSLATARLVFQMVLLRNGNVLAAGGQDSSGLAANPLASAEVYNPATGAWAATGALTIPRTFFQMVLLPNGNVLAAGGRNPPNVPGSGMTPALASAEVYNPTAGTWTATGALGSASEAFAMVLLSNGNVLAAGQGYLLSSQTLTTPATFQSFASVYNPAAGTWTATGAFNTPRIFFQMILLPNGNVLAAGGESQPPYGDSPLASAEVYNPAAGTWTTTGPLTTPRANFEMVLLPNGNVLAVGGSDDNVTLASAEVYNPAAGTWTATGPLATARGSFQMVLL